MMDKRRLATIMMVDVVGSSRLVENDEAYGLRAISDALKHVREAADRHAGRLIKTLGDGALLDFASPVSAVVCATQIQHTINLTADPQADGRCLKMRIGIEFGDVIASSDGDVHGHAVNKASRLQSLAPPGGIAVSSKVHSELSGKIALEWRSLGSLRLKNMSREEVVWVLDDPVAEPGDPAPIRNVMSPPTHLPGILQSLVAAALGGLCYPLIAPAWNIAVGTDPPKWAENSVPNMIAAGLTLAAIVITGRSKRVRWRAKSALIACLLAVVAVIAVASPSLFAPFQREASAGIADQGKRAWSVVIVPDMTGPLDGYEALSPVAFSGNLEAGPVYPVGAKIRVALQATDPNEVIQFSRIAVEIDSVMDRLQVPISYVVDPRKRPGFGSARPKTFNVRIGGTATQAYSLDAKGETKSVPLSNIVPSDEVIVLDRQAGLQETFDFNIYVTDPGAFRFILKAFGASGGQTHVETTGPVYLVRR